MGNYVGLHLYKRNLRDDLFAFLSFSFQVPPFSSALRKFRPRLLYKIPEAEAFLEKY